MEKTDKTERTEKAVKEERERSEKQPAKQERSERSTRQGRRDRARNKKDMEGEIVLLDEDMEFVRLDEEDTEAGGEGKDAAESAGTMESSPGAADAGYGQAEQA